MVQEEALKPIIELLNTQKIPYMFVGAIAVNYYSVPRLTHDADLVVQIESLQIETICMNLKDQYYVDDEMIEEAISSVGQFNVIHYDTGFKIDFWILKQDQLSRSQFTRCRPGRIFGMNVFLISPEDLILSKLVWFKESANQKHYLDAVGVYRMQNDVLDMSYLCRLIKDLRLTVIFNDLKKEAHSSSNS